MNAALVHPVTPESTRGRAFHIYDILQSIAHYVMIDPPIFADSRSLTNELGLCTPRSWGTAINDVAICAPIVRRLSHNRRTASRATSGRHKGILNVTPLFSTVSVLSQPLRDKRDNGTTGTSGTRDRSSGQWSVVGGQ